MGLLRRLAVVTESINSFLPGDKVMQDVEKFVRFKIVDNFCEQWSNIPEQSPNMAWPYCYVAARYLYGKWLFFGSWNVQLQLHDSSSAKKFCITTPHQHILFFSSSRALSWC